MTKRNDFRVKKLKKDKITVEETEKKYSPFILFFISNGRLIFSICLLLVISLLVITSSYLINNLKASTVVTYMSDKAIVTFEGTDKTNTENNTPITDDYANQIFEKEKIPEEDQLEEDPLEKYYKGVVIKLKEIKLKNKTITYYSDKTALVDYGNGKYLRVFPIENTYGIDEKGTINKKALTKEVTGEYKNNNDLNIKLLYLSDGSIEVTKDGTTFFVRNKDITSLNDSFYTNLSKVAIKTDSEEEKVEFSNGTIKENDHIIVNNIKYYVEYEKVFNNIKIIYYENGYAEIINDNLDIIVEKSDHINYTNDTLEIIDNTQEKEIKIENLIDIKKITINNTNKEDANYMIVLEETDNYSKYNITNILPNEYIHYTLTINGNKIDNKILNNNIKNTEKVKGIEFENDTYLIYEGELKKTSKTEIKLGLWVDYETITNEYMNSSFIGTIKVYVVSK